MLAEPLAKGVPGLFRRMNVLPQRYGFSPERIRRRLEKMHHCTSRWDLTASVPVTGSVVVRHPGMAGVLHGFDLAVHGYRHVDYSALSIEEQAQDLDLALGAFAANGLAPRGFRAPYLKTTQATGSLLPSRGLFFDSSLPVLLLPESHPLYQKILPLVRSRYPAAREPTRPFTDGNQLVEVPVAMPDDEILVDGLRIHNARVLESMLQAMLHYADELGTLIVFQVHPERFGMFEDALASIMQTATDLGAWKASLSQAAAWAAKAGPAGVFPNGAAFGVALSGDLDAATLWDFATRYLGD